MKINTHAVAPGSSLQDDLLNIRLIEFYEFYKNHNLPFFFKIPVKKYELILMFWFHSAHIVHLNPMTLLLEVEFLSKLETLKHQAAQSRLMSNK